MVEFTNNGGKIYIISGPSGVGKNTVLNEILKLDNSLVYLPSYTTRGMRPGESQENPYIFIDVTFFKELEQKGEFIEFENIHGHWYGTSSGIYAQALYNGRTIVKDIDVNGAIKFKKIFHDDACLIYLQPPSEDELLERLSGRGDTSAEDIVTRTSRSSYEDQQKVHFDHIIVNDVLENTVVLIMDIIRSEK